MTTASRKPWESAFVDVRVIRLESGMQARAMVTTKIRDQTVDIRIRGVDMIMGDEARGLELLIAQAPAMARLLLQMHENGTDSLNPVVPYDEHVDAVLRAAGVLP